LTENIDYASDELIAQDKQISSLQGQAIKLKQEQESLQKDLNLAQKLAESRKVPYYSPEDKGGYLQFALYSLATVVFVWWLMRKKQ
jgi:hypothetical protein